MDSKVVIDASVWVSRFIKQDVNFVASSTWIQRFTLAGGLLVAPTFLQTEVAAAVSRLTNRAALAREVVQDLKNTGTLNFVPIDDIVVHSATNIAIDLQLRAGDTLYVAVAHLLGIPLVSWDKEQLQRASSIITTYSPTSYSF